MIRDSKLAKAVIYAYKDGYRVVEGQVISPHTGKPRALRVHGTNPPYHDFTIKHDKKHYVVRVHQLIAYQKFGKRALAPGVQVRHMDGNSFNNRYSNIRIGDASDNAMDRPAEERHAHAVKAASKRRKYTDADIAEMRRLHATGWSYKRLMEKFGVTSKGTMSNIINNDYSTIYEG